jgi:hypothetical protein
VVTNVTLSILTSCASNDSPALEIGITNGSVVTRRYHQSIEVYDNRAVITQHNVRPSLDVLA